MFCHNCGHELEDGSEFCSKCGSKTSMGTVNLNKPENQPFQNNNFVPPPYEQNQFQNNNPMNNYQNPNNYMPNNQPFYGQPVYNTNNSASGFSVASMVLGICSLVFCCIDIITIIAGVIAVIMGIVGITSKKAGKNFAVAGICMGAIALILYLYIFVLHGNMFESWDDWFNARHNINISAEQTSVVYMCNDRK